MRATEYRDVTYTVCAAVTVPSTLSFRYVGGDQFLLNGDRFVQDTGTAATMCYAFNTTAESNAAMEDYLEEYTGSIDPTLDYESKQGYAAEFEGLRGMFTVVAAPWPSSSGWWGCSTSSTPSSPASSPGNARWPSSSPSA